MPRVRLKVSFRHKRNSKGHLLTKCLCSKEPGLERGCLRIDERIGYGPCIRLSFIFVYKSLAFIRRITTCSLAHSLARKPGWAGCSNTRAELRGETYSFLEVLEPCVGLLAGLGGHSRHRGREQGREDAQHLIGGHSRHWLWLFCEMKKWQVTFDTFGNTWLSLSHNLSLPLDTIASVYKGSTPTRQRATPFIRRLTR